MRLETTATSAPASTVIPVVGSATSLSAVAAESQSSPVMALTEAAAVSPTVAAGRGNCKVAVPPTPPPHTGVRTNSVRIQDGPTALVRSESRVRRDGTQENQSQVLHLT